MNRKSLDVRLVAMLLIFLMASVSLIPTWSPTQAQASGEAPCTGCGQKAITSQNVKVEDVIVLEGEERNKAIATALSSQDYKNVKEALVERGYTPQIDDAIAGTVVVYVEGVGSRALGVVIPFSGGADYMAKIVFVRLNELTMAAALVGNIEDKTESLVAFSMNGEVKFPVKGSDVVPLVQDECQDDAGCVAIYGPGYCCGQACAMNPACLQHCLEMVALANELCILTCYLLFGAAALPCIVGCYIAAAIETAYCYYKCCWLEGQVYKVCYHCGVPPCPPYCDD